MDIHQPSRHNLRPRNDGIPFAVELFRGAAVNLSAVERRVASLPGRRTVKQEWQAAWLVKALQLIDLTTLAGDDTPGRVQPRPPAGQAQSFTRHATRGRGADVSGACRTGFQARPGGGGRRFAFPPDTHCSSPSARSAAGGGCVQRHGRTNKSLHGLSINLLALVDVDGTPGVAFEAGIEEA